MKISIGEFHTVGNKSFNPRGKLEGIFSCSCLTFGVNTITTNAE